MAESTSHPDVLLLVAAFSRHHEALEWGRAQLEDTFGPIGIEGAPFEFCHTKYYERTMGAQLSKQLWGFAQLIEPDSLAQVKIQTNLIEQELTQSNRFPEPRPLNLDPGILTLGKFVLATTKDQAHRIYLRDGIYAEVTLSFRDGQFEPWPWTYRDYREPHVRASLKDFRDYYRTRTSASR